MKKMLLSTFVSGIWIGVSEFLRNELLFKSYWLDKYAELGLTFPSETINNAMWAIWSFVLAAVISFLVKKLNSLQVTGVTWTLAFLLMWIVIWNLDVLPMRLLFIAIPWSVFEVAIATMISKKIIGSLA